MIRDERAFNGSVFGWLGLRNLEWPHQFATYMCEMWQGNAATNLSEELQLNKIYEAQKHEKWRFPLTRWLPRVFSMKSPSGHECGIDYSDQMVFYATTIRKGIKCYRKLGVQLLLGISVLNALTVYKIATRKDVNIRRFRELLTAKLLGLSENTKNPCLRRSQHNIAVRKNDSGKSIRRSFKLCYADKRRRTDRSKTRENLKKTTYCPNCSDQPQLCIECFKVLHSK